MSKVSRVPITIQMENLECGAACLVMILAYYKKYIPLEQVRKDCGVSRDGSNAKNLLRAARAYGLKASGYKSDIATLKKKGTFPCVIHWNFNHFVVLCGFRGRKAVINDPARGRYAVPIEEFAEAFTGIWLSFQPGEAFVKDGKPKNLWAFAIKKVSGHKGIFALVVLTTVIMSIIGIMLPGFSNFFVDELLREDNPEWFGPFIWLLAAVVMLYIATSWIQQVYLLRAEGKISIVSNAEYMWHVLRLPMEFFAQRTMGDLLARKDQNEITSNVLIQTLAPLLIHSLMMLFYVLVMISYSRILTAVGLISILLSVITNKLIANKRVNLMRVAARDQGKLSSTTLSGIEAVETIKASGYESGFLEKWSGYQAVVNENRIKYTKISILLGLIPTIQMLLVNSAVLMGGLWLCMNGQWTLGMVTAFNALFLALMQPAQKFTDSVQTIQEMRSDMERIEDVLAYPQSAQFNSRAEEVKSYNKLKGNIEVKDVSFGYSKLSEPLIRNFSLSIKTGQSIALVGASGCGKSTVAKLIGGLYEPWNGEILFDGQPIDKIDRSIFTASIAVVDQDITIFEDTVENNIRMWDDSIEDFEVIMAARDACIHEDILLREDDYSSHLLEGGANLSGGEKQRLEIARALAQDTPIIIMDEATSALDAKTEFEVMSAIRRRGVTSIIVAHRLSTIKDCDEIILMDHGQIVERGTHQELYARGGMYTALITNE